MTVHRAIQYIIICDSLEGVWGCGARFFNSNSNEPLEEVVKDAICFGWTFDSDKAYCGKHGQTTAVETAA